MHLKSIRMVLWAVALTVVLCSLAPELMAQNVSATLTGTVTDATSAVVPKANVTLKNELNGDIRRSVSNNEGFFGFVAVPPGTYTVTVEMQGFSTWESKGVNLDPGDRRNVSGIVLKPGSTTETVTVEAGVELITPVDSGEKSAVISQKQLQNVSVLGRNAAEFIKIMPGMAIPGNIQNNASYSGEEQGTGKGPVGNFAPNGQRTGALDITADGAHVIDPGCNCGQAVNTNADMMQEIKVMTSNFGAEASKGPVVISAIGKQGGQDYHGEGYLYVRHNAMNANDWYNNSAGTTPDGKMVAPRPETQYWYPGFQIGGPVRIPGSDFNKNKDKLFFHFATEYYKQDVDNGIYRAFVPTADMRKGIYTQEALNAYRGNQSIGYAIEGAPNFPNGIVPASEISKHGQTLINLYPMPNVDPKMNRGSNYVSNMTRQTNMLQIRPRVDYSINDNTKLYVSYNRQQDSGIVNVDTLWWRPDPTVPYPSPIKQDNKSDSVSVNLTKVFNPTLTNEFIFTYTHLYLPNSFQDPEKVKRSALGLNYKTVFNHPTTDQIPNSTGWGDGIANMINNGGWDVQGGSIIGNKVLPTIADNVAKVWGTHTAKFGFYWETVSNEQPQNDNTNGQMTWANWGGNSTGNAYADMLAGRIAGYEEQNLNAMHPMRYMTTEFYAQDSWKVTRRLTLDFGARFSRFGPWSDKDGIGFAIWDPSKYSNNPADKQKMTGLLWNKLDSSIPLSGVPAKSFFFNPRFGFAWDVNGTGKTVIRGGYGLYHFHDEQNVVEAALGATRGSFKWTAPTATTYDGLGTFQAAFATPGELVALEKGDNQQARTQSYSFTISRRLPWSSLFEVAYVGNKSDYLSNYNNGFGGQNYIPANYLFQKVGWMPNYDSVGGVEQYRPMSNYGKLKVINHKMYSNYNSLQASWNKQSGKITYMLNYTFSKSMGIRNEGGGNGGDPTNISNMYGVLANNRTHIFNAAYVIEVPGVSSANRLVKGLANGWQISGITAIQSGANLQATAPNAGFDVSGYIPAGFKAPGGAIVPAGTQISTNNITGTPDINMMPMLLCDPRKNLKEGQYINGSCFAPPLPGVNGTFIMPLITGPAFFNSDLSLFKNFQFSEARKLQFRFSAYNFLNHPLRSFVPNEPNLKLNFDQAGKLTSERFGFADSKLGHRIMQLAVKFYF